MRIIIVGGGIGGLATAVAVRHLGMEAVILERKDEMTEAGAGLGLYPNAMKALQHWGADGTIRRVSVESQATEFRTMDDDGLVIRRRSADAAALYGDKAYTVHRADIQRTLMDTLPDNFARTGSRVVAIEQTADRAVAILEDGERIEGDVLIGADGLRSSVRDSLFGETEARFTGIVTWRCLIPAHRLPERYRDIHTLWLGDNRHAMLYGVRQDQYCCNAFVPADEGFRESWSVEGDPAELPALYPGACDALVEVLQAVETALITPIYFRDPLEEWGKGRIALLGDAAHPAPPSAGQGAAMAIEDALMLAYALKRHGQDRVPEALLDYADRRKARTRRMLLTSRVGLRVNNEPDAEQRRARNSWLVGGEQFGLRNGNTVGWLWAYDPVAAAVADQPVPEPVSARPECRSTRPEVHRAFDLLADAITPEERSQQWLGERTGYARLLSEHAAAPNQAQVKTIDCDGVEALLVSPDEGPASGPIVLHLHGSGLTMGTAAGSAGLAADLARAAEGEALVPDYRLAPEHPFPAALDDAQAAFRWLRETWPDRPVIISGEGAGGGIALALAVRLRDTGEPLIEALHLVSPWLDLTLEEGVGDRSSTEPLFDFEFLKSCAACYIGDTPFRSPEISPLFASLAGLPPILIQAVRGEALECDAERLAKAAEVTGVRTTFDWVEDSVNGFLLFDFLPERGRAIAQFGDFVKKQSGTAGLTASRLRTTQN